ncbi:MAG: hypothetical protein AAF333_11025 [Planctomycetota bacterium]
MSIIIGLAGVFSGFKPHVLASAKRHGTDAKDLFFELGQTQVVAGQEDQIERAAVALASAPTTDSKPDESP